MRVHRARGVLSWIRLGRGDSVGALEDVERSLEHGRQVGDPQGVLPSVVQCAYLYAKHGRRDEARALAEEALAYVRTDVEYAAILDILGPVALQLGVREEMREALEGAVDGPWENAARAGAAGDHSRAADILALMGAPALEAFHRLAAAETLFGAGRRSEAEAELERALAFYRTVGATAYLDQGEALLAATA